MQCACPVCGILMAQVPKGLDSCCQCAQCAHQCHDCMGRDDLRVYTKEELMTLEEDADTP